MSSELFGKNEYKCTEADGGRKGILGREGSRIRLALLEPEAQLGMPEGGGNHGPSPHPESYIKSSVNTVVVKIRMGHGGGLGDPGSQFLKSLRPLPPPIRAQDLAL